MKNLKNIGKSILVIAILLLYVGVNINGVFAEKESYITVNMLNQNPDPAQPGDYVKLRWMITKQGNEEIRNVTFLLEPNFPISFDPGVSNIKRITDWWGSSDYDKNYYILYYKVRVSPYAIKDNYDIYLKYTYNNGKTWITQKFPLRVNNDRVHLVIGSLYTSPPKLVEDTSDAELDVEIQNVGKRNAQNVNVLLSLPKGMEPTYEYSNIANLGTIPAGGGKIAKFFIDIDKGIKQGIYNATLTIHYTPENSNNAPYKELILPLSIPIKAKPYFEIEKIITSPNNISAGDKVKMKIIIKNTGGKKAETTSIRVFKDPSLPFTFNDKTDYIGTLYPNQEGEGLISFDVDKDAEAKEYLLDLEIRCVSDNNVVTQEKTIKITVGKKRETTQIIWYAIILSAIASIIGYFMYIRYNKRRTKKKKG